MAELDRWFFQAMRALRTRRNHDYQPGYLITFWLQPTDPPQLRRCLWILHPRRTEEASPTTDAERSEHPLLTTPLVQNPQAPCS